MYFRERKAIFLEGRDSGQIISVMSTAKKNVSNLSVG